MRLPAHRGIALAYAMAAIGVLLMLSLAAVSFFFPILRNNDAVTRGTVTTRLVRQAAYALAAESGDSDADGAMEAPAFQASSVGPAGGGALPASTAAPTTDGWNKALGYCAWDNGSTNTSTNRIAGDNPAGRNSIVLAVISAGRDHVFQTACSDLKSGSVKGDDIAFWLDQSQVRQVLDGTTYYGDAMPSGSFASLNTALIPDGQVRLQSDTNQLMRWNAAQSKWVAIASGTAGSGSGRNRNFLINGNFDIWQRNGSPWSIPVGFAFYTADRWKVNNYSGNAGATVAQRVSVLGVAGAPAGARYALQVSPAAGNTQTGIIDSVENVATLAGQTVTLSWWARLPSGGSNAIHVIFQQQYGNASAPPDTTTTTSSQSLSSTWTRYSATVTLPAISNYGSIVVGSDDLHVELRLEASSPVQIAQVQLEPGSTATTYDMMPLALEFLACQRYYETGTETFTDYIPGSTVYHHSILYPVPLRVANSNFSLSSTSTGFTGNPSVTNYSVEGFDMQWQPNNTSEVKTATVTWSTDADY